MAFEQLTVFAERTDRKQPCGDVWPVDVARFLRALAALAKAASAP